jgi:hypothetical protein
MTVAILILWPSSPEKAQGKGIGESNRRETTQETGVTWGKRGWSR